MTSHSSPSATIVQVAIASPLYRLFDYLPQAATEASSHPVGTRVLVPFGRRQVVGIVAGHAMQSELPQAQLKAVQEQLDPAPLFDLAALALARWMASYYHHPLGEALFNALPNALRKASPAQAYSERCWQINVRGLGLPASALARAP
ncbi:MAG: primosomal protein N', partial [Pseudomonadales bacterium]|nr:primosomal protein N' [Pseudomonadales bacterium]